MSAATLDPASVEWIGLRFLDPTGRTFRHEGEYYRAIYPEKVQHVRWLFEEGIVDRLVEKGLLIPSKISDLQMAGYGMVLHHQRSPFDLGTPYWNRSLLRDAGRVVLDLNLELLKYGLCTIDAHGGNIRQVDNCRPVWVDFGSIIPMTRDDENLVEFRRCYTNPIKLFARRKNLSRVTRALLREGGILDEEVAALRGAPFVWAQRISSYGAYVRRRSSLAFGGSMKASRERLLKLEREKIEVSFPELSTPWSKYQGKWPIPESYDQLENTRRAAVVKLIREIRPKRVLDLAGNKGFFSFMAARHGCETLCMDYDEGAVEGFYEVARKYSEPLRLASGCADVMRPRQNYPKGDFVLALALTHHLAISQGFHFSSIANVLSAYSTNTLIVEFMPFGIGIQRNEPDPLPEWYTFENFLAMFRRHFGVVEEVLYPKDPAANPRRMVLCRERKAV